MVDSDTKQQCLIHVIHDMGNLLSCTRSDTVIENASQDGSGLGRRLSRKLSIHLTGKGSNEMVDMDESQVRKVLKKHELIQNHKEKQEKMQTLKKKVSAMDDILYDLQDKYYEKKGCCICLREGYFIEMISETLESYETRVLAGIEVNTEENELGTLDAIGDAAKTAMMSPIKKMLQGARKYSIVNHTMLNLDKHYLKMTEDEIINDMILLEDDIHRYEIQYANLEPKFTQLNDSYKESRSEWFWTKYKTLAKAIELAIEDCLKP